MGFTMMIVGHPIIDVMAALIVEKQSEGILYITGFWIHFWIHRVRDVSPSLKFQRFQNCKFVRLPPSAPRQGLPVIFPEALDFTGVEAVDAENGKRR